VLSGTVACIGLIGDTLYHLFWSTHRVSIPGSAKHSIFLTFYHVVGESVVDSIDRAAGHYEYFKTAAWVFVNHDISVVIYDYNYTSTNIVKPC
jgi:hypothetical protein